MPGRCGRKLRYSIERFGHVRYCTQFPLNNRDCCRRHGGLAKRGIAAEAFKTGAHSRYVPDNLRQSYELMLADPQILNLKHEIVWHRVTVDILKAKHAEGVFSAKGVLQAITELERAAKAGDVARIIAAISQLKAAATSEHARERTRAELRAEDDLIRKLEKVENDRMAQLNEQLSREQALTYMRIMALSLKEAVDLHVHDVAARKAILGLVSTRFDTLVGRRDSAYVAAGRLPARSGHPPADE